MITHDQIIAKAREFVGTPYVHQGRIKRVAPAHPGDPGVSGGIDCLGVVLLTCQELGLHDRDGLAILGSDYTVYDEDPQDGFIHREFLRRAIRKPREQLAAGDFVTLRFLRVPSHCGIVSSFQGGLGLIHCYRTVGKVAEHVIGTGWLRKIEGVFTLHDIG